MSIHFLKKFSKMPITDFFSSSSFAGREQSWVFTTLFFIAHLFNVPVLFNIKNLGQNIQYSTKQKHLISIEHYCSILNFMKTS